MANNVDIRVLLDLFESMLHFGERLAVQRQVLVIAVVIILFWLLSAGFWYFFGSKMREWADGRTARKKQWYLQYTISILHSISFPALVLVAFEIARRMFLAQSWHIGLLTRFIMLFWAILIYRVIIGILYTKLGQQTMRRYHFRFVAPLFIILCVSWLVNNLVPISKLAEIKIWDGFTNPITLGALIFATLGFYFWYDGSGVAQDVLHSAITPRTSADPGTVEASLTIGRYVVIAIGLFMVFTILGFDSTMLAFVTGGLSVGIGFGSKEIISNLISGILLLFDQSLRPGDIISIDGEMAMVKNVGIRATTVKTIHNIEVVIPNQTFLSSSVTTYTKSDRLIQLLIPMETANKHDPNVVREALLEAAHRHPLVAETPEPVVYFRAHGDSSHLFNLGVWFDDPMRSISLTSELYFMMHDSCTARDVEPSTPQRELQILNQMPWENGGRTLNTQPSIFTAPTVTDNAK